MASLVTLTYSQPTRTLKPGETLIAEGDRGGDLYVLESGRLTVERGGSVIARIDEPGALVGEMSVLTGSPNSATVRADGQAIVRVVADAMRFVMRQPEIGLHIATVLAQRLDATSAVLSALRSEAGTDAAEQSRLGRIVAALFTGKAGK
ncbi:MAG TPA: cyclic nucleotide-binding domain-containing protein [Devosia sp.]|jgi:CRP-like cAMP-binding protein|nr:cyclic nucleotide-binding domain-containing protein [Devosia sp.]